MSEFESTDLIPAQLDDLDALTAQINAAYAAAYEQRDAALHHAHRALDHAIRAGHLLHAAKAQLGHGAWLPWLREHTVIPRRTAAAWMRLAANEQRVAHLDGERQALRFLTSPRSGTKSELEPEPAQEPESPPALVEPQPDALHAPDALPPLLGAVAEPEHEPAPEPDPIPAATVPEEARELAQRGEAKAAARPNEATIVGQWHRLLTQWRGIDTLDPEALVRAVGAARLGEEIPPVVEGLQRLLAAALDSWPALVTAWWQCYGSQEVSAQQLLDLISEREIPCNWGQAKGVVALGQALAARKDTVIGGFRICRSARLHQKSWRWSLRISEPNPTGGELP